MTLYQIVAIGRMKYLEAEHKIHSKRVFRSREEAEAYVPTFMHLVTTDKDEHDLMVLEDGKELRIAIVALDLAGGEAG